jgi:hypothetical protein
LNNECSLDPHGKWPEAFDVAQACSFFKECDCAGACFCPTTSNHPGKPPLAPPSAPCWAVLGTRSKTKLAEYQEAPHHVKAAKLELVLGVLQVHEDYASESTQAKNVHSPCIYSPGLTLSDSPLTDSAHTQQWSRTWSSISPDAVAKILAVPSSQLSQEGCLVIEIASLFSQYFETASQISRLTLVHAMLLWNAFLDRDSRPKPEPPALLLSTLHPYPWDSEAGPESQEAHTIRFIMVPLACFQMACKFWGGEGSIAPRSSDLMDLATNIRQRLQGLGVTITETMHDPRVHLTGRVSKAELQVLPPLCKAELEVWTALDWDICILLEINQAENLVARRRVDNLKDRGFNP